MGIQTPGKKVSLMITAQQEAARHIRAVLSRNDITISTEFDSLSSHRVMQKAVAETGNTIFIRKSFSRFISNSGLPNLIVMDYRLYLGPDPKSDPDRRKLLRTIIISYILLMRKGDQPDVHGTFILLAEPEDLDEAARYQQNPAGILDLVHTTNEEINAYVEVIKNDPERFNRSFRVRIVARDRVENEFETALKSLNPPNEVSPHNAPEPVRPGRPPSAKEDNSTPAVACVIFRTDAATGYRDNEILNPGKNTELDSMAVCQFHIVGRWEKRNLGEVTKIIQQGIRNGIGGMVFKNDQEIVINLCSGCTIDGTVISPLFTLFTRELADFKNKRINVNLKNGTVLEQAPGYIMIKKFIRHVY